MFAVMPALRSFGAFVGNRHGKIIDMMFLQSLGYLIQNLAP